MYELRMVGTYIDFLLKGDALSVINSIACSIVDPHWSIASILVDIRMALNSVNFLLASLVVREANTLAHNLAG